MREPDETQTQITVIRQRRKSLAFQMTPTGAVVRIPAHLDPGGEEVQRFIADALARLPNPAAGEETLTADQIGELVAQWCARLQVQVKRVQVRAMRSKWGSISTAGMLTLADDILRLPLDLAEYIVVHELMHLRYPDHRRGWRVSMGMYLPDRRERDRRLRRRVAQDEDKRK